ncbi:MAG: NAD-glutamate dehydrogenase [Mariprofundales bacterium]|nr:NAD-glutamate dehydrogenase [Mariprofundales bacterium]
MRYLRDQLITLLNAEGFTLGADRARLRLSARLLHGCWHLLGDDTPETVLAASTLTFASFHRHLLLIRCPDQAFYYDAVRNYLLHHDIGLLEQQTITLRQKQDDQGRYQLTTAQPDAKDNLMLIALHISATLVPDLAVLRDDVEAVLQAVALSVQDFDAMRRRVAGVAQALFATLPDQATLLEWLLDDKYIFYGIHNTPSLGIASDKTIMHRVAPGLYEEITALNKQQSGEPRQPGIYWWQLPSTHNYLYNASMLEVVQMVWELRGKTHSLILIGHFSRSARHFSASRTPFLKPQWKELQQQPILRRSAFYRRELRTLFDSVPKPMLLSIPLIQWLQPLKGIVDLADSSRTVVSRLEPMYGMLDYLMVTLSTTRFGPNIARRMEQTLDRLGLCVIGMHSFGVASYRVLLFSCRRDTGGWPTQALLEQQLNNCITFWRDRAKHALMAHSHQLSVPDALKLLQNIAPLYQESFPPEQFADDYLLRQQILADGHSKVRLRLDHGTLELQLLSLHAVALGLLVEQVQAFGLTALDESVATMGENDQRIVISQLRCSQRYHQLSKAAEQRLAEGLERVMNGECDHDPLNALLLSAGLEIDQVAVMITLRNYLVQLEREAAITPLTQTMLAYPKVSRALFSILEAKHRPAMPTTYAAQARLGFEQAMEKVQSLSHDRWFRVWLALIEASLRCNQWTRQIGEPVVLKIDGQALQFGPTPRPWREIFVHGSHVEGIHLRAGPVARGGLRYSDRPTDFRTEVHELMLTQTVKNGQIVPTGAKGGFVVRGNAHSPSENPNSAPFVEAQYRQFIAALLSVTDNLLAGELVPPTGMVIPEADRNDPYFVVAADKGTARYSDTANAIAQAHHFWLDDAFASGGCHGYDHKKVGITARGAWICAVHHFHTLGLDATCDAMSVIGIGDMGGDVFGNGLLCNPEIRLLAAFNHRHIFIDPDPDVAVAFAERRRLFVAVAGWDQYNPDRISGGGGVFLRSAKSIPISAAMRKILRINGEAISGEELIRALLSAKVDLLYNGGIGTYIKAEHESHVQVRDPVNNAVRINAEQVHAKVISEGGNLGLTQAARIVLASRGVLLNTDAIDNAAGVNMSDHEVNLKILLHQLWPGEDNRSKRNQAMARQTEAVTRICLNDQFEQAQALTLAELEARTHPPRLIKLRDRLQQQTTIDRTLLDDAVLPLRPQLAQLLGYEKNRLHGLLNGEAFFQDSCFGSMLLARSFPRALARRLADPLRRHPLAADLAHTQAANYVVNRFGLTCVSHLQSMVDNSISEIVQALMVADHLLEGQPMRDAVWSQLSSHDQAQLLLRQMQEQVLLLAEELLRLHPVMEVDENWLRRGQRGMHRLFDSLNHSQVGLFASGIWRHSELKKAGIAEDTAWHLTAWPLLARSAVAAHLAGDGWALSRLLEANHAVLLLLPMLQLEAPLRSMAWSDGAAHQLRREWLQNLSAMRCHAVLSLLRLGRSEYEALGRALWHRHPLWDAALNETHFSSVDDNNDKLQLLLALSRLQGLVEQT